MVLRHLQKSWNWEELVVGECWSEKRQWEEKYCSYSNFCENKTKKQKRVSSLTIGEEIETR